jgi:hypothetical protein
MAKLAVERQCAVNLLFDSIETDIVEKEKFVLQQIRTIQEM